MKTALVLLFSLIPSLHAESAVLAMGSVSLGNGITTVTASCSASDTTYAACYNTSSEQGLSASFGASATVATFGTPSSADWGYGVALSITNTINGSGASTVNIGSLGQSASYTETFTINSPFSTGYFGLYETFGVWGSYPAAVQETFTADSVTVVSTQSVEFYDVSVVGTPFMIPFTSGVPITLTITLSAGDAPPTYNLLPGEPYGGATSYIEGLLVFDASAKLDTNSLNIVGSAVPQMVPEPSTFALGAVAIGGLLLRRRLGRKLPGTQK